MAKTIDGIRNFGVERSVQATFNFDIIRRQKSASAVLVTPRGVALRNGAPEMRNHSIHSLEGARVYHYGGCPDCPEYQDARLAYLVGRSHRSLVRPQNLICPICLRSLLPASGRWTYFIQASSGEIKIGSAIDLIDRIGQLQAGHPHKFQLLALEFGPHNRERQLHTMFAEHREQGEWFYPAQELIEYAQTHTWVDLPFFEVRDAIKESGR